MGKQVWNNHYKLQIIDEISQLIKRDIVNAGATTPDSSASKEAELAQEIREISFEHLLLYTISVAFGHWASLVSV